MEPEVQEQPGSPRILVVRLSSIGDVVRVIPALNAIRYALPMARIDWVVEDLSADLISDHLAINNLYILPTKGSVYARLRRWLTICRTLRRNRYDIVIDFHGILKSGLITRFTGASTRYGLPRWRCKEGNQLFTNRKVQFRSRMLNWVDEFLSFCELLDIQTDRVVTGIEVSEGIKTEVDGFIEPILRSGKVVVAMHVPVSSQKKQWPLEHFAQLADLLLRDGRFRVVFTHGPGQETVIDRVRGLMTQKAGDCFPTVTLKHYAWLAHRAHLYFGNDSGPMHISWTMGTPVVAVFGGSNPLNHGPYGVPCEVLCDFGLERDKNGRKRQSPYERLQRITPQMAYDACLRLMCRLSTPGFGSG